MAGSLELGSLTALPLTAQRLQISPAVQPQVRLLSSLGLSPALLFLTWRRRLGERRRHLSCLRPALCRRRAHPQVCSPLLFSSAVRDGAPQTLTKLLVFGSESSCNILPTNFDFVCKNYRVYMCAPMSYAGSAPHESAHLE